MAKLSANGCHAVAKATKDTTMDDGTLVRHTLALRSDGKVLRKISFKRTGQYVGTYWQQGDYTILGSLSDKDGRTALDRFNRYSARRGYSA